MGRCRLVWALCAIVTGFGTTAVRLKAAEAVVAAVEAGRTTMFGDLAEDAQRTLMEKCFSERYGDFFWREAITSEKQKSVVGALVRENLSGRAVGNLPSEARRAASERVVTEKLLVLRAALTAEQLKALHHYELTLPQRIVVHTAAARLVGTDDAFSLEQTNQLVELLFGNEIAGWLPPYPVGVVMSADGKEQPITSRMLRLPGQFFDYTHRAQAAKFLTALQLEVFEAVEKSPLTDLQFWK